MTEQTELVRMIFSCRGPLPAEYVSAAAELLTTLVMDYDAREEYCQMLSELRIQSQNLPAERDAQVQAELTERIRTQGPTAVRPEEWAPLLASERNLSQLGDAVIDGIGESTTAESWRVASKEFVERTYDEAGLNNLYRDSVRRVRSSWER